MRDYWSLTGNDRYDIGCTGQTVFLLDKKGTEIAKFKDLIYAYDAAISPCGDIFAVNSSEGILAVYSFSPPALQKKFRYAKADWGGGDSFCFSPDGSEFFHIQPYLSCLRTSLAVYDTGSFTLKKRILYEDDRLVLDVIEYDRESGDYFLLGFYRNTDGIASKYFVGKLKGDELSQIIEIPEKTHWFYHFFCLLRAHGFTKKSHRWSYFEKDLEELKRSDYFLADLWKSGVRE